MKKLEEKIKFRKAVFVFLMILLAFILLALNSNAQMGVNQVIKKDNPIAIQHDSYDVFKVYGIYVNNTSDVTIKNKALYEFGFNNFKYKDFQLEEIIVLNEKPVFTINSDSTIISILGVEFPTSLAYQKYKQECYNDSTFVISGGGYEHNIESVNDTLDLTQLIGSPAVYIITREWVHKTPTFEDFLNWLERRTK